MKDKQPDSSQRDTSDMAAHAEEAARLLAALSNPHRLLVLCILAEGESSVGQLLQRVPLSQSALSQHLAVLRRDRLVDTRRVAQAIFYSLHDNRAARVVELLHDIYCPAPEADS